MLESGAGRNLLQFNKENCQAWPLGRNKPSTRTGWGHPAWKQPGTEGPGVLVGTAVSGSQQRALGQRGLAVSWLRWDSRGGDPAPLLGAGESWGVLGSPGETWAPLSTERAGPSGESPGRGPQGAAGPGAPVL